MDRWTESVNMRFGEAVRLLYCTDRAQFMICAAHDWIIPAIFLDQIIFNRTEAGDAIGFCTWAFLSDEVAAEFRAGAVRPLHLSEWNEGINPWIIDAVNVLGNPRSMLRQLRERLGAQATVQWIRERGGGLRLGEMRGRSSVGTRR